MKKVVSFLAVAAVMFFMVGSIWAATTNTSYGVNL